jgi:polar amino acid transport system permease protein
VALTRRQRRTAIRGTQYGVLVVVVLVLAFAANWRDIQHGFFDLDAARQLFPDVLSVALVNTVKYTVLGFLFGLILGLVLALMRLSSVPPYRWIATGYIEFFRGVPALLVFLAFGFGVPIAFHFRFTTGSTVVAALGLVGAAYMAETIRAGIQAVPKGQLEAARSLGMSQLRAMVWIIIPQAFRIVLPPLTSDFLTVFKNSALALTIGVFELTAQSRQIESFTFQGFEAFTAATVVYLAIALLVTFFMRALERRVALLDTMGAAS